MSIIAAIRGRRLYDAACRRAELYDQPMSESDRMAWQLERINNLWPAMVERIAQYRDLVAANQCPRKFRSLDEFTATMPATTKTMVQTVMPRLVDPIRPHNVMYTTGGSTGEPTHIPGWKHEDVDSKPNRWLGRHWFGIKPGDKLFMIWGHSHLLGTGFKGRYRAHLRTWKDSVLGYYRFSAYQLDEKRLRLAGDEMMRFQPQYVIAYSAALDFFARVNRDRSDEFKTLHLKGAFGTGERFPFDDGPPLISSTLQCPVGMEYGSVETGVMGHSLPNPKGIGSGVGQFRLYWRSYLYEAGEVGPSGGRVLRITSLFPRKFPLMRFEIGDEVHPSAGENPLSLTRLDHVIGKSLSFVTMDDGTVVHSVTFEHSVRNCPGVQRFQLVNTDKKKILKIVAPGVSKEETTRMVLATMGKIHPSLAQAEIEFTDTLLQTPAGKTPIVIHLDGHKPLA